MIENDKQYRITISWLTRFRKVFNNMDMCVYSLIKKAERDAIESVITNLETEIREYEEKKKNADTYTS